LPTTITVIIFSLVDRKNDISLAKLSTIRDIEV